MFDINNSYLISIGYSLGYISYNEKLYGKIDIGSATEIVDFVEYSVWQLIFRYGNKKELVTVYDSLFNDNKLEDILKKLISKGIVIEINDDNKFSDYYQKIKEYKLFRQGFGIGLEANDSLHYKVVLDKEILLDSLEFGIWSAANNRITIEEVYKYIEKDIVEDVFTLITFNLYQQNLVYFTL